MIVPTRLTLDNGSAGIILALEDIAADFAPIISDLDGDIVTYTEKGPSVHLDAGGNATVTDADSPDFDNGTLRVSITANGAHTEDQLGFARQGAGPGQIDLSGGSVTYGGVPIGSVAGGSGGNDLVFNLNGAATPEAVQALVRALTYSNINTTNPSTSARTVQVILEDGDGGISDAAEISINVVGVNDAPVVTTSGGTSTFIELLGPISEAAIVDGSLTINDVDNDTLASATVVFQGTFQPDQDVLSFHYDSLSHGNISGDYDADTGVLTLLSAGATATLAEWQSALRAVTYNNTSSMPDTTTRTIGFIVSDGTDHSAAATKSILVVDINDPPTITAPDSVIAEEDLFTPVTGISFSDVDAGTSAVEATFSIPSGSGELEAVGTGGISVTLTGNHTVTLNGSLTAINDYIAAGNLKFRNNAGNPTEVVLTITIDDAGNSGGGPPQLVTETVLIDFVPEVVGVQSTSSDGVYTVGDTIIVTVTFNRSVTVDTTNGTPTLLLETGAVDREAMYLSGTGTDTLIFAYTVQAGDVSGDLDYHSDTALMLNGATITSAGGTDATLTLPAPGGTGSLADQHDIVVDGSSAGGGGPDPVPVVVHTDDNGHAVATGAWEHFVGQDRIDTVTFTGSRNDHTITRNADGTYTIEGSGRPEILTSIERLQFDDGILALDIDANPGLAFRLYRAAFDREPDAEGLGYWIDRLDNDGIDLIWIAHAFVLSEEFSSVYGDPSALPADAFINLLYWNVLDREAEGEGFAYWQQAVAEGASYQWLLAVFSESQENRDNVASEIGDGIWL